MTGAVGGPTRVLPQESPRGAAATGSVSDLTKGLKEKTFGHMSARQLTSLAGQPANVSLTPSSPEPSQGSSRRAQGRSHPPLTAAHVRPRGSLPAVTAR